MLLDLNAYSWPVFKKEINKLAVLALPMLVAQVAQVGIGFVDTVMAGGAGKDDLAAVALGSSVFATIYITFMGVMTALNPMIAQLFGAGKADEVGETGRQGIWFGVMLGIIGMLLMWLLVWPFQAWLSLSDKVENMMALYMFFTGLAMPAAMVHRALHAYASSLNRPRVIMIVSFLAFLLNIPLNYAFVYGKFGMPALEQVRVAYEATVLAALKDVEDALVALQGNRERLQRLQAAADAAANAALMAQQRYASGLIDFATVLETQRTQLSAQDSVATTVASVAADHVRLYKALGGGWQ